MKKIVLIIVWVISVVSCAKKTIPSVSHEASPVHVDSSAGINPAINADTATVTASTKMAMLVVSDANGKLYVSQKNIPPEANVKFDYLQLSKGLTPQQKANLQTRYKTIPPRVLYVAPAYQLSSLKGSYYIYKKKFWYWKKKDGLFYLDEKYYL